MKKTITAFMAVLFVAFCFIGLCPKVCAGDAVTVKNGIDATTITDVRAKKSIFYLPGTIDITKVKVETNCTKYKCNSREYAITGGTIDLTPGKTTDQYGNVCYKIEFVGEGTYTFYSGSEIGTVYVKTSHGIQNLLWDKNYRDQESTIIISDEHGEIIYSDVSLDMYSEIKGRGNASYNNEKKPFQIKLGKKTDLFGMGKAKTWILLANYNDASYIRSDCAFKIADAVQLPFTPKSVFVDLYIDNEYQGIYQLCEKTQIGKNRIEITDLEDIQDTLNEGSSYSETTHYRSLGDSINLDFYKGFTGVKEPDDITGGYLVELDNLYSDREPSIFRTLTGNTYTVKSPEYASEAEMDYIANLFSDFEQALYSESGYNAKGIYYTDYCDLESLVKVYVVEEITKNWDTYIGSIFFYKDVDSVSTKIYAGPVWDFDNTWGNIQGRLTFATDKEELWAVGTNIWYKSDFGAALTKHADAKQMVSEIYPIAAACLEQMLTEGGYIDTLTNALSASAAMDMALYPVERRDHTFIYFNTYKDDTTDSAVGYLTDFMRVRTAALYDSLNANPHVHALRKVEREEPTCTENGVEEYWICDACGKLFSDENAEHQIESASVIPATGHILEKVARVDPTCTEQGMEEYWVCSLCGKMFSDETAENQIVEPLTIEALGHDWGEWVVTKEPTTEEEGVETRTCTRDPSHTETRSIPKKEVVTEVTATAETSEATTTAETVVTTLETQEITTASTNNAEPTEASTEANDKGCGSYIGFGGCAIAVIVSLGSATVIKKKKIN